MENSFILFGNIVTSLDSRTLASYEASYLVCVDGICRGIFKDIPEEYEDLDVLNYEDQIIIPGMTDLHTHGPQYNFHGIKNDLELLDWLDQVAFPEEGKYSDLTYAERSYDLFVENLYEGPTTRAVVFASIHTPATILLMEQLEEAGLVSLVGKVNMDRNAPDYYVETTEESLAETREWIDAVSDFGRTYPILTPRLTPTSSDALMKGLRQIQEETGLPLQSHLSENLSEIDLIASLQPETHFTAEAFSEFDLFGGDVRTVMAHCIWSTEEEIELIRQKGVYVAHCPECNMNIASGIAPIRKYLDKGIHVGLATDGAPGSFNMFQAVKYAIHASKMYYRYIDQTAEPLTFEEAFYMATAGGASFFEGVGSEEMRNLCGLSGAFREGYEFDAVILDDSNLQTMWEDMSPRDRVERIVYHGDDRNVVGKFIRGTQIF